MNQGLFGTENPDRQAMAVACCHVMTRDRPIRFIRRDDDGDYQFRCDEWDHGGTKPVILHMASLKISRQRRLKQNSPDVSDFRQPFAGD